MENKMLYVGFCRVCKTGPLGLRVCGSCDELVILCDECDAVWTVADVTEAPSFTDDPALPCPHCGGSLVEPPSHWADPAEVDKTAWLNEAIEADAFTIRMGKAFLPNEDGEGKDEEGKDGEGRLAD